MNRVMNQAGAVSFALLLVSTAVIAQTTSQSQPQVEMHTVVTSTAPDGSVGSDRSSVWTTRAASQEAAQRAAANALASSCPISLHARQAPGGDMMEVNGKRVQNPGQRLHLSISESNSRRIVAANVTVRGFSNKARSMPTLSAEDSSDAAKIVDVRFPAEAGKESSGKESSTDLAIPGLTAVTTIDLNSVTYSDGSTWKLAAGRSCRSWVDGLMLVSSH
jgi:hypothetical protein